MFGFLKSKSSPPPESSGNIRDTLFGDMPIDSWPANGKTLNATEPWASFMAARESLKANRISDAILIWRRICEMPNLESRHYAQAWNFLQANAVPSPANQKKILFGVVVEVPMKRGLDLLAAYADLTARYINFTGSAVIWEHPDNSLDQAIVALLENGKRVMNATGPWNRPRPAAPQVGILRINIISSAGLHFGEGAFQAFAADAMAKPVLDSATVLMQQLVARAMPNAK
jgi:hypothetical protein